MKKILSLVIITVLMATGCSTTKTGAAANNATQKETSYVSFEYSAITRGSFKKVIVKQDSIISATGRDMQGATAKKLSSADWNTLLAMLKKINLQNLPNVEVPSKKHQFDGALGATLQIITQGTAYQTPTFDHGNPPAEVKDLTDKILALSDLK